MTCSVIVVAVRWLNYITALPCASTCGPLPAA